MRDYGIELMRAILARLGLRRWFPPGLGRDVSLALLVKLILLAGLFALVSRLPIRPADTAAATAAAVAGIAADFGAMKQ